MQDPDPRVNGGGLAMLRAAGIAVTTGVMDAEARELQAGFLTRIARGRPMLTLKLATSLDGRIATASGESRWITGPEARRRVHLMRARHDAVLVGGGTARADDPVLTVRELGVGWQPVRVIASAGLDLPCHGRLAASLDAGSSAGPLWLLHGPDAPDESRAWWRKLGARLIEVPAPGGQIDPAALVAALSQEGITRVFCEGGGALGAALMRARLVDRLAVFGAGLVIGAEGRPGLGDMGLETLASAPRFRLRHIEKIGSDILQDWHSDLAI
jgi:diaminohydroxyphosphoribosylaminopyrimidine deaminase/5-amino-6-(5-phosphoribosylamino)uracil reductase